MSVLKNKPIAIYLYGSRVGGGARRFSNIDIALEDRGCAVDDRLLADIRERLEDSDIPYTVEVVDLFRSPQQFRDRVHREGVKWNG